MTENLIAKYTNDIRHARLAAGKAVHLAPKPSRRARAMSSAADPILAMASAPFQLPSIHEFERQWGVKVRPVRGCK